MSIGPLNDWNTSLVEVTSVTPISGAEGLWAGAVFVFGIWFVIAAFRIDFEQSSEIAQEFGDPGALSRLLAFLEGEGDQSG